MTHTEADMNYQRSTRHHPLTPEHDLLADIRRQGGIASMGVAQLLGADLDATDPEDPEERAEAWRELASALREYADLADRCEERARAITAVVIDAGPAVLVLPPGADRPRDS